MSAEIHAGRFGATQSFNVTGTADELVVDGPNYKNFTYLVGSDKIVHLKISPAAADAAAADSLRVPPDTLVRIMAFGGDHISFILGTGETDGTIWFTEVP